MRRGPTGGSARNRGATLIVNDLPRRVLWGDPVSGSTPPEIEQVVEVANRFLEEMDRAFPRLSGPLIQECFHVIREFDGYHGRLENIGFFSPVLASDIQQAGVLQHRFATLSARIAVESARPDVIDVQEEEFSEDAFSGQNQGGYELDDRAAAAVEDVGGWLDRYKWWIGGAAVLVVVAIVVVKS